MGGDQVNDHNLETILSFSDKEVVIDFLQDIVHPDAYGWAVTEEVRAKAYILLKLLGARNG